MRVAAMVKKTIKILLIILLTSVILICGFELRKISAVYTSEAKLKSSLAAYHPGPESSRGSGNAKNHAADTAANSGARSNSIHNSELRGTADSTSDDASVSGLQREKAIINQNIVDLKNEINRDVVGWLTIPDTNIDYPFVLGEDNSFYLNRDITGKSAVAGSLFMDSRCSADLSDFNTIIYGHNMKNHSMFGDLQRYADTWFFNNNRCGTMYLENATYTLEIFAYMVVRADDKSIYDPAADSADFFDFAQKNARNYRAPAPGANVVTLSTCGYEYTGARIVVLASIYIEY